MTDAEKNKLLQDVEKQRRISLRKRIFNEIFGLLFVLAGFVFILCSFLVTPGSFYLLFFLIGILIILFLPIVFMYQAKSETKKYQSHVLLSAMVSQTDFYESYSLIYREEEWKLPKGNILKEKAYVPHCLTSHHKGRIQGLDFTSFLYASPEKHQHGRVITYLLDAGVPSEIDIISKKRMYAYHVPKEGFLKDEGYPDHISFKQDASVVLDDLVSEVETLEKEYSFDMSLVLKGRNCQVYLEGIDDLHLSLHHVFDEQMLSKVLYYLKLEGTLKERLQLGK